MHTRLLAIVLAILVASAASTFSQTIRTLGYNSTNGQIVAGTNVVWTNSFNFSSNAVAAQVRTNLGLGAASGVEFNAITVTSIGVGNGTNSYFTVDEAMIEVAMPLEFAMDSAPQTRTNLGLGSRITTNRTFVSYNGTNYTTNSVSISNGVITGWTQ